MSPWKRKLLDGASELFTRSKKSKDKEEGQAMEAGPFQQIGRLQMELEWLKKVSAALMPVNCASWSITSTLSSASAVMNPDGFGAINALLPARASARIDSADHGQDRCALPGGSLLGPGSRRMVDSLAREGIPIAVTESETSCGAWV